MRPKEFKTMTTKSQPPDYPLLFTPIYKNIMWGGDLMSTHLDRDIPSAKIPVAEAWEIADRPDAESIVENGPLTKMSIRHLIEHHKDALMGKALLTPQKRFPLLVKLIDAGKRLSLQVHPDAEMCVKHPDAEPKTEMWYVIAAKKDARIFAGLKSSCTRRRFLELASSPEVEECLQSYQSMPSDAYFINAGTVHAIGAGNLLLEIQQNSNTTYRISDWGRIGPDGKPRELHLDLALECVNFADRSSPRIPSAADQTAHNRKLPIINKCPFFHVDDLRLIDTWRDDTNGVPHVLTAIDTPVVVETLDGTGAKLERGRSCLVPAACGAYRITFAKGLRATVVRTTLS